MDYWWWSLQVKITDQFSFSAWNHSHTSTFWTSSWRIDTESLAWSNLQINCLVQNGSTKGSSVWFYAKAVASKRKRGGGQGRGPKVEWIRNVGIKKIGYIWIYQNQDEQEMEAWRRIYRILSSIYRQQWKLLLVPYSTEIRRKYWRNKPIFAGLFVIQR